MDLSGYINAGINKFKQAVQGAGQAVSQGAQAVGQEVQQIPQQVQQFGQNVAQDIPRAAQFLPQAPQQLPGGSNTFGLNMPAPQNPAPLITGTLSGLNQSLGNPVRNTPLLGINNPLPQAQQFGQQLYKQPLTTAANLGILAGADEGLVKGAGGEKGLAPQDIQQYGDKANPQQISQVYQQAAQNKPVLDNLMNTTAQQTGARVETNFKNPDTLAEKVVTKNAEDPGRDYTPIDVNDVYRGRIVYPDKGTLYQGVSLFKQQVQQAGLQVAKETDFFKNPEDGYQGYHVDIQMPNQQHLEVQFHTEKSLAASLATHDFHAQYGDDEPPPAAEKQKAQLNHEIMDMPNPQAKAISDQIEQKNAPLQQEAQVKAAQEIQGNPEPLPWEQGNPQGQFQERGTVPTQAQIKLRVKQDLVSGKTIGELQQATQDPDLTSYENALNSGDVNTMNQLAAKHPEDARYQIHNEIEPLQKALPNGPERPGTLGQPIPANTPPGNAFTRTFNPLKAQPKDFQEAVNQWDSTRKTAQVDANQVNLRINNLVKQLSINPKQEEALVYYSQHPNPAWIKELQRRGYPIDQQLVDRAKPILDLHRQLEDSRFSRANDLGVSTAYKQNHIFQAYKEDPATVEEALNNLQGKGLNRKPGFTYQRKIPDFIQAQDAGLHPRYTTFGQFNALSEEQLGKAVANQRLLNYLLKSGYITEANNAPRGYQAINSDFFPRSSDNQRYFAAPQVAPVINNIFGGNPENFIGKGLNAIGKGSAKAQATILTTPGYSVHGFTIAQAGKDLASGVGSALTVNPITGAKIAINPFRTMLRAFVPGAAKGFENAHADSIREMATQGIGYTGKFDYKELQPNVAAPKSLGQMLKGLPHQIEQATVGTPTFQKFMFQRRVSLYEAFRDQAKGSMPYEDAISLAGKQLKAYDGIVNELGRDPQVNDFMKSLFFAPKYRESVINSLINTVKGTAQLNNDEYLYSRSLFLGMAVAYLGMNMLNQQYNNGKNMWENDPGHELELSIPDQSSKDASGNIKRNYYVPWMPGFTAVPRSIVQTFTSLARGDTGQALQNASGLFASPIQVGTQALTGKNYFGQNFLDPTKPQLPQQAAYVAKNLLVPGSAVNALTAYQNAQKGQSVNPLVTTGRIMQLPIKENAVYTPYFNQLAQAGQSFKNVNDQNAWNMLHPTTKDINGNPLTDKSTNLTPEKYTIMLDHPNVLPVEQSFQQSQPNHAPLWDQPIDNVRAYMAYSLSTDPGIKAQVRLQNPWIPQLQYQMQQYGNQIAQQTGGQASPLPPPNPMEQLTQQQVQAVSAYTAAAKGSIQRKQLLAQNPWLPAYWNANTAYYQANPTPTDIPQTGLNKYLTSVGISPIASTSSSSTGGTGGGSSSYQNRMARQYGNFGFVNGNMIPRPRLPRVLLNKGRLSYKTIKAKTAKSNGLKTKPIASGKLTAPKLSGVTNASKPSFISQAKIKLPHPATAPLPKRAKLKLGRLPSQHFPKTV